MQASVILVLSLCFLLASGHSQAVSGADVLLKSLGASNQAPKVEKSLGVPKKLSTVQAESAPETVKIESLSPLETLTGTDLQNLDELSLAIYRDAKAANLNSDLQKWVRLFLTGDLEKTTHFWSVNSGNVPSKLMPAVRAMHLASLWSLNLPQTWLQEWASSLADPSFARSQYSKLLLKRLDGKLAAKFIEYKVEVTQEILVQMGDLIDREKEEPFVTLRAIVAMQNGRNLKTVALALPNSHPYKFELARRWVWAVVQEGNLAEAGRILKTVSEPAALESQNPLDVSTFHLDIARILYQAGQFEAAESYFRKIGNRSPYFLESQVELAWSLLLQGKNDELRGLARGLTDDVFTENFIPDAYVIKAISDLKFCYFGEVEKSFSAFKVSYMPKAQEIDRQIKAEFVAKPRVLDVKGIFSAQALESREKEKSVLTDFENRSIQAALPAVGIQKHWKDYSRKIGLRIDAQKRRVEEDYARVWRNEYASLQGSMERMKFVKAEAMSQIYNFTQGNVQKAENIDAIVPKVSAPSRTADQQVFKFDGLFWPDEILNLRSLAEQACSKQK